MPRVLTARNADGSLDPRSIAEAARLLREGRLVAIPTETVYGLGANALDADAVRGIFEAKGRPSFNPLIVHVLDADGARSLAGEWPERAEALARAFWPGPLTLVVPRGPRILDLVTGGLDAVAFRAPAHEVARAVIAEAGVPIAAPSANRSGAVSPTSAAHVVASLGDRIDAVLDGGPCDVGIESTVVDVTGPVVRVLRPGGVSPEALERVVGRVERVTASLDEGARASPGMLTRHYAPEAHAQLVDDVLAALDALPSDARIGAIVREIARPHDARLVAWERLGSDATEFARGLYAALHRVEAAGATHVLLERPPEGADWDAIRDRLTRAAAPR